ncbi:MerR family transcriptional regulator [Paucilactobacillus wasatchensis]|nr:MerR family transcriptional regulator [Paucilactobacillus wasatchensis]
MLKYRIGELAQLANISTRSIRFYESRGLLKSVRNKGNNYREYTSDQVDRLQEILFYRELDVSIDTITKIINDSNMSREQILHDQKIKILIRRDRLNRLLKNIDDSIINQRGETRMSDIEKFEAFKKQSIQSNEKKFGTEIKQLYDQDIVKQANQRWQEMTQEEYRKMQSLEQELFMSLKGLLNEPTVPSAKAEQVFHLHQAWLTNAWGTYNPQAHLGLVEMYVNDDRFTKYYDDRVSPGATLLLNKVIHYYIK